MLFFVPFQRLVDEDIVTAWRIPVNSQLYVNLNIILRKSMTLSPVRYPARNNTEAGSMENRSAFRTARDECPPSLGVI
jgi:hypothetical protein